MTSRSALRPSRRQAALALASLTALSLTACGGAGGEAEFEEPAGGATAGSEPSSPVASDGGGQDEPAQATEEAPDAAPAIDPADAVDTLSYPLPSTDIEGTMTVGLHHLRVRGETMELLLTFTPEFETTGEFTLWELHGENHSNVGPVLFDRVNLKRYDILATTGAWDTEGVWNSKQAEFKLASGDTQAYWANFAAPVDDIDVMDVALPAGAEFADVPIEQGPADDEGEG